MKPEAQRIAIAEACGWKFTKIKGEFSCVAVEPNGQVYHADFGNVSFLPDYTNDLNTIQSVLKTLTKEQWLEYPKILLTILCRKDVTGHPFGVSIESSERGWWKITTWEMQMISLATAAEIAEAFLRTLDLWVEEPTDSP